MCNRFWQQTFNLAAVAALLILQPYTTALAAAAQKSKLDVEDDEEPPIAAPPKASAPKGDRPPTPPSAPRPAAPPVAPPSTGKSRLDSTEDDSTPQPDKPRGGDNAASSAPPESPKPAVPPRAAGGPDNGAGSPDAEEITEPVCDKLIWQPKRGSKFVSTAIELLPDLFGAPIPSETYRLRLFLGGKSHDPKTVGFCEPKGEQISRVIYYEARALQRAAKELGVSAEDLARLGAPLSASNPEFSRQKQRVADFLGEAVRVHDWAVNQNLRRGKEWPEALLAPLVRALFNLRLSDVDRLIDQKDPSATAQCDKLHDDYRGLLPSIDPVMRPRFERIFLSAAQTELDSQNYQGTRFWLRQLEQRFASGLGPAGAVVRDKLVAKAAAKMNEAENLTATDPHRAGELFEAAAEIWPELPNLEAARHDWSADYPSFVCAYLDFPDHFRPLLGQSEVERHASALLFEGLVRWTTDERSGSHFATSLAEGRPTSLERGRMFRLPHSSWSDSEQRRLTGEDVIWTEKVLAKSQAISSSLRGQMIDKVTMSDGNPLTAAILLNHDYWQPMALMQFKVLPKHRFPLHDIEREMNAFVENPVGTGPYVLVERESDHVRFAANPHYRTPQLPRIREITLRQVDPENVANRFDENKGRFDPNKVQLIYGLRRETVNQLRGMDLERQIHLISPPAVYFLAPNHRHPALANENVRLAIAHAINRTLLIENHFRNKPGILGEQKHELTGPFPIHPNQSWAYSQEPMQYQPAQAKAFARAATQTLKTIPELSLLYPSGDNDTEAACRAIQNQVGSVGITLKVEACSPTDFYERVAVRQNYDLAYWRHQYSDDSYYLGPLVDRASMQRGGTNFLGYQDKVLTDLVQEMLAYKKFTTVQERAHKIHEHVFRTACVIPLWQLDVAVAVSDRIQPSRLDPIELFGDIEHWQRTGE